LKIPSLLLFTVICFHKSNVMIDKEITFFSKTMQKCKTFCCITVGRHIKMLK